MSSRVTLSSLFMWSDSFLDAQMGGRNDGAAICRPRRSVSP